MCVCVGLCTWVCAHMHGSSAQCEGTVGMGQEGYTIEWSLQSQKQWGVSPDVLIPGRPLKEGLDQRSPSWLAIHTQVPPQGPWVIILPSVSFTDAPKKMFTLILTYFFSPFLFHPERLLITFVFLRTWQKKSTESHKRLRWVWCDFLKYKCILQAFIFESVLVHYFISSCQTPPATPTPFLFYPLLLPPFRFSLRLNDHHIKGYDVRTAH